MWEMLTSLKGQVILAGFVGGAVRWMTLRDTWQNGLIAIGVGGACAYYASPLVEPALSVILGGLDLEPVAEAQLHGFLIGIGGVGVAGFLIDLWRAKGKLTLSKTEKPEGKKGEGKSDE